MISKMKISIIAITLVLVSCFSTMAIETKETRQSIGELDYYLENGYEKNIFWLFSDANWIKRWHLAEQSRVGGGGNQFNMADLNTSFSSSNSPMKFEFPWQHRSFAPPSEHPNYDLGLTATYDSEITPYVNITVNTNYIAGKTVHLEIRFDCDGDGIDETKAQFEPFTTTNNFQQTGIWTEEFIRAESTGYTNGAPGNMEGGYIELAFWRADGITDQTNTAIDEDWLSIYCGAFNKTSWLALPYKWEEIDPIAVIDPDPDQIGEDWWCEPQFDPNPIHHDGYVTNVSVTLWANNSYSPIGATIETAIWQFNRDDDDDGWYTNVDGYAYGILTNYTFERPGIYWIQLSVTDQHGLTGWCDHWINISQNEGIPPVLESLLIEPNPALVNTPVYFFVHADDDDGHATLPTARIHYQWDFDGDGHWDTNASVDFHSPHYTYDTPGTYDVSVKIFDGPVSNEQTLNITETHPLIIKNNEEPVVDFTVASDFNTAHYPEDTGILAMIGDKITFNFSGCYDPDNLPGYNKTKNLKIEIDWDDHSEINTTYDNEPDVEHEYMEGGPNNRYDVSISITDGENINEIIFTVHIDVPPVADAGPPEMGTEVFSSEELVADDVVVFDGSGSYDPNDDLNGNKSIDEGEIDNCIYSWDFGDNSTSPASPEPYASHSYDEPRTYTATVTVTDIRGQTDKDTVKVYILTPNNLPIAQFEIGEEKTTFNTLETILFDAEDSYDPDDEIGGHIIRYYWNFGDGNTSTDTNPSHNYADDGEYVVTLEVEDDRHDKSISITKTLTINNQKPIAKIGKVADVDEDYDKDKPYIFTSESTDIDGVVVNFYWEVDGKMIQDWSNSPELNHTFTEFGKYVLSLKVKDDDGAISEAINKTINVPEQRDIETPGFGIGITMTAITLALIIVAEVKRKRRR